ncbi:MAG: CDP-alcohol phosphatidyltransferase family protein [Acidimicrobiales bacterium]
MADDGERARQRQKGVFEDRILTVPNGISLVRLACIPIFLWLLFGSDDRYAAAWLWGVLGATDWVDGWWARRFDVVSEFGKLIDPVTDRAVLIVGILAVGIDGSVPWWLVALTLAREGLVALAGVVLGALGGRRIDVTWWGKCATFGLYFAFPFLLAGASDVGIADWFRWAGWICAVPSLVYSYLSAAQYVPLGLTALREGRLDRAAALEDEARGE